MFGGWDGKQMFRMNDVYIIDLQSMVCEMMISSIVYGVVHVNSVIETDKEQLYSYI